MQTAAPAKSAEELEAETLAFIERTMRRSDGAESEEQEFHRMRARFAPGQTPTCRSLAELMAEAASEPEPAELVDAEMSDEEFQSMLQRMKATRG
jgi:hypothetical protein